MLTCRAPSAMTASSRWRPCLPLRENRAGEPTGVSTAYRYAHALAGSEASHWLALFSFGREGLFPRNAKEDRK